MENTFKPSVRLSAVTLIPLFMIPAASADTVLYGDANGNGKAVESLQPSAPNAKIVEGAILNGRPNAAKLKAFADKY